MFDSNETPVSNYTNYGTFSTAVFNSSSATSTITLDWTPVSEPAIILSLAGLAFGGAAGIRRHLRVSTEI